MSGITEIKRVDPYENWLKSESINVFRGVFIEDVNDLGLTSWPRTGGKGAYVNFDACAGMLNSYVCEILPNSKLNPDRHLFEEIIFVLEGNGNTTIWDSTGKPQTFGWKKGSLFSIPINASHQHSNPSSVSTKFISFTNAPMIINLFRNLDFIFRNPFDFKGRFDGESDYWTKRTKGTIGNRTVWQANLVNDLMASEVPDLEERGKTGRAYYIMGNSTLAPFLGVLPVGSYSKAHRHGPSAHIITLAGTGYTLLWKDGREYRFDWKPGSLVLPPDGMWHQIFNTGDTSERSLRVTLGGPANFHAFGEMFWPVDSKKDQIEYQDEQAGIRQLFEKELAKNGVKSQMP